MSDRNFCGGSDLMLYKELYKESKGAFCAGA